MIKLYQGARACYSKGWPSRNRICAVSQESSFEATSASPGRIVVVCPGGLEHGGGIGRQMGYFLQARQGRADGLAYEVVDSRGPWFLGASPFHTALSGFYLAGTLLRLLAVRCRAAPSLLHVNITGRGSTIRKTVLLSFARLLRLRYLLHVHDYDYVVDYHNRGVFMRLLTTTIFRHAEIVVVLGSREREALSRALRLPPDRIIVLHNAVPDRRPCLAKVRRREGPPHLLFLGHLSERKGVPELLHALASPSLISRPWRATLAGGGPIERFRILATDLGVADKIDFPGWLDKAAVKALCADVDVLVLPSHAEGLAMAVLEGLSYGLCVITTPVGAHPEVIEPDVSGILVPPGDAAALAGALLRVIDDEQLQLQLGIGARRRFLRDFEIRAYVERLSQLHVDLLARPRQVGAITEQHILPLKIPVRETGGALPEPGEQ
jgi:glycosyltransferase involved in cell wall biosynthesis